MNNPFLPPAPAKPARARMHKDDIDMMSRTTAKFVHGVVKPLEARIAQLEADLAYARSEAEKALSADLTRHLGEPDDDAPTMEKLNEMAAKHKESKNA